MEYASNLVLLYIMDMSRTLLGSCTGQRILCLASALRVVFTHYQHRNSERTSNCQHNCHIKLTPMQLHYRLQKLAEFHQMLAPCSGPGKFRVIFWPIPCYLLANSVDRRNSDRISVITQKFPIFLQILHKRHVKTTNFIYILQILHFSVFIHRRICRILRYFKIKILHCLC